MNKKVLFLVLFFLAVFLSLQKRIDQLSYEGQLKNNSAIKVYSYNQNISKEQRVEIFGYELSADRKNIFILSFQSKYLPQSQEKLLPGEAPAPTSVTFNHNLTILNQEGIVVKEVPFSNSSGLNGDIFLSKNNDLFWTSADALYEY